VVTVGICKGMAYVSPWEGRERVCWCTCIIELKITFRLQIRVKASFQISKQKCVGRNDLSHVLFICQKMNGMTYKLVQVVASCSDIAIAEK